MAEPSECRAGAFREENTLEEWSVRNKKVADICIFPVLSVVPV